MFRSLRHNLSSLTGEDHALVQRLDKANPARRRHSRYWQRHAQKLATIENPEPVISVLTSLELHKGPEMIHHSPQPVTNTLDSKTLETQSVISSATTARDLEGKPADLPPPSSAVLNGQDFVCPYCFVLCPSAHGHGRAWG